MKKGGKRARSRLGVSTIRGTIAVSSRGVGYLAREGNRPDIEIAPADLNTALHGDEVEVLIRGGARSGQTTGAVVRILRRLKTAFVGTLIEEEGGWSLHPDDRRLYTHILLKEPIGEKLRRGDKAFVELLPWHDPTKKPEGRLVRLIGRAKEHETEMIAIALDAGFRVEFPPEILREAQEFKRRESAIFSEELPRRRDFRSVPTFTIDPSDAKDFDDALSLRRIGTGEYEVGVHIADVSHFVRAGTALDREARARGFSLYLVDRTIPMLPEVLSDDLCSLNPHEDKLAFSAVFRLTPLGRLLGRWFGKSIIRSAKRLSYEEAQGILEKGYGPYAEELVALDKIAKRLCSEKLKAGAIDFDKEEVHVVLDRRGRPVRFVKKERLETHRLVEEFMLLANREVAEFMTRSRRRSGGAEPFIYRIHDVPDREKIAQLALFVRAMGHDFPFFTHAKRSTISGRDLQALFEKIEGRAEEGLIKTAALRSMAKAIYSTENIGHFGLSFPYYTHFTSPIRRYADLVVHRLFERELAGLRVPRGELSEYRRIAVETSLREMAAAEAERTSLKYKQVEFMAEHVGESFEGTVTGVSLWGLYVAEAGTNAEGMVKFRNLPDDYYELDEKTYSVVGRRTRKRYTVGDCVRFRLAGADLARKILDYTLLP